MCRDVVEMSFHIGAHSKTAFLLSRENGAKERMINLKIIKKAVTRAEKPGLSRILDAQNRAAHPGSMLKFKKFAGIIAAFLLILSSCFIVNAQTQTYTVVQGDSMWKIAVKYQIGLSELVQANSSIKDPTLIYPGQKIYIPNIDDVKVLETEVVRLVNAERAKAGLPSLAQNWELSRVARYKSQDFIDKNYFDHNSPTYGTPFQMMTSFSIRYSAAGENIAKGQNSPSAVMNAWMNSPGHKSNIMSSAYNQIGVGVAKDSKGNLYWTQMFIKAY